MTNIPESAGNRQESLRAEATRRNVTVYRVRVERAAQGRGRPPGRIQWNKIQPEQRVQIRKNVPRKRWRPLVDIIIRNNEHWETTLDSINEYDYWEDMDWILNDRIKQAFANEITDREEFVRVMHWYHGRR